MWCNNLYRCFKTSVKCFKVLFFRLTETRTVLICWPQTLLLILQPSCCLSNVILFDSKTTSLMNWKMFKYIYNNKIHFRKKHTRLPLKTRWQPYEVFKRRQLESGLFYTKPVKYNSLGHLVTNLVVWNVSRLVNTQRKYEGECGAKRGFPALVC